METKYIAVVDFGNSRTGFAWCISGQVTGIQDIYIQRKWPGLLNEYAKTYTELFYDSQLDKWYFGGEAHQIRFTGKNFEGNYVKGEHFQEYKKELYYISQGYSEGGDSLEKQYDKTMDLIVETLKVMKKFIWEDMNEKLGAKLSQENFEQGVQWVLAVPESATKSYKDYMRKAAIKAGLIKEKNKDFERLVFISEPDAAIITSINDGSLKNVSDDKDEKIIIVFDAGSEMVRASVKKWCPDNFGLQKLSSIKKVCEVYEPAGVKYIDNCFFNYLLNLFGTRGFGQLLNKYRDDYNNIATSWSNGKENITSYSSGENFEIEIDISALWKILEDISPDEYKLLINEINKNPGRMINRNNYKYVFSGQYNRYLIINREMFEFIFHKVFENAYLPLKKVLEKLDAQDIKCDNLVLLFTGGFSRNPCLKEFIDKQVSNDYFSRLDKIRYVQNTVHGEIKSNREGAAVLFGAVLLGVYNVLYKQYIQIGEDIKMLCKRHKKLKNYATQLENRYMEFEDGQWIQKLYLKRLGTLFGKQYKFKEFTIELQQFQQRYKELIENAKFLKQQYKELEENAKFLKQRYNQFMDNIIHSSLLQKEYKEFSYNVVQLDKGYKSFRNKEFVFALGDKIINFLKL